MAEEKPPVETVETATAPVETPAIVESALGPEIKAEAPKVETPVTQTEAKAEEKPAEVKTAETKVGENPAEVKVEAKPTEVKIEDKKPEVKAEEKVPEVKVEAKPAELPKYEPLTLPEGVKLEEKQVGEIDSIFANTEVALKAPNADPHAVFQKLRQGMVEYGLGVVKDAIAQTQKQAEDFWAAKTQEYRKAFESDPEIGGSRKGETTEAARQFIAQHAGSPENAAEVRKLLYEHKLADHPLMIRLLANANLARAEGKPLVAQKAVPIKGGKPWDKMYGEMR